MLILSSSILTDTFLTWYPMPHLPTPSLSIPTSHPLLLSSCIPCYNISYFPPTTANTSVGIGHRASSAAFHTNFISAPALWFYSKSDPGTERILWWKKFVLIVVQLLLIYSSTHALIQSLTGSLNSQYTHTHTLTIHSHSHTHNTLTHSHTPSLPLSLSHQLQIGKIVKL